MSRIISVNKTYSYETAQHKTPVIKKESSQERRSYDPCNNVIAHPPILMDEYGQTPDHYYLARKPPTSFFQVKRKLDLQSIGTPVVDNSKPNKNRTKKKSSSSEKPNGRNYVRYDTSLGQLTKKFLKLLSDATDGVINLNTACALLSVPKRRLYDITNVLEGAGLIQKTSRNNIQWKGRVASPCGNIVKYDLEKEIDILEAKENKLDELIYYMKSEIERIKDKDEKYQYVTSEDLRSIKEFSEQCVIGVKTPPVVQIAESNEKTLVVSSQTTEIEAYLLYEGLSFTNIVHSKALIKEDSYEVNGNNSLNEKSVSNADSSSINDPASQSDDTLAYDQGHSGTVWSEGEKVFKNAFITDEDDIAPMGKHFLLQTEDQDNDFFFESAVENYAFSLDEGEGLTDLFDCDFASP